VVVLERTKNNYCLNCDEVFASDAKYCHQCGQTKKASNLSFLDIVQNFTGSIFNLEGSAIQTFKYIWHPAYLTRAYVAGRRKSFLNPARLFFVSLVIFFATISFVSDTSNDFMKNMYEDYFRSTGMVEFDEISSEFCPGESESIAIDSIRARLYDNTIHPDFDTLESNFSMSLLSDFEPRVLKKDLIDLSVDSIQTKYGVEGFLDQQKMRQFVKTNKNTEGSIKFILSKIFWGFVPAILIFSLLLSMFYYRSKIHYLEHLVLTANIHSVFFQVICVVLLFQEFIAPVESWMDENGQFVIMIIGFFVLWTMFNYYKQNRSKTILKFSILSVSYLFILAFFAVISAVIISFTF